MARPLLARRAVPLCAVIAVVDGVAAAAGGCFDGGDEPVSPPAGGDAPAAARATTPAQPRSIKTIRVGRGARGAVILRPSPAPARPPVVVFLHGWGLTRVSDYGPWLRHLAKRGNVVIFPRYQLNERSDPGRTRRDALAGLKAALARVPVDTNTLVVAGHSAGGAVAADYAAISGRGGLPRPLAVFSVYPGRAIIGYPAGIPAADYSRIPANTLLVSMAGASDSVVGRAPAQGIVRGATQVPSSRRRYVLVKNPLAADHLAPTRSAAAQRRAFWRRLDSLISRARR